MADKDPYVHEAPYEGKYKIAVSSHRVKHSVISSLGNKDPGFHSGMVKSAKGVAYIPVADWEKIKDINGVRRMKPEKRFKW